MGELRLRVASSYGPSDFAARFDDHTTVGQLADAVEQHFDRAGHTARSIHRRSRGSLYLGREARLVVSDLRNGDEIELGLDTGLRGANANSAVATLRIVDGPEAGRTFELQRGESTAGRSKKCDVTLNDDMASRVHATIRVSDIVEIADAGSTNGVIVNGEVISGVRRLRPGDTVLIGDTSMVVDLLGGSHEAVDLADNSVEFNRPPRIDRPFAPVKISLPSPLDPPPKQRLPLIAAAVPLLMGVIMVRFFGPTALLFTLMSPLMLFGNYWEGKRSGRRDYADRKAEYEATLNDQTVALEQAREEEARSRFRFSPSNDELLGCVADLSPLLWEREVEDPDFLSVRVGLTEQASSITVEVGSGGSRDQRMEMQELADSFRTLPPVPLAFDGRQEAPVGIAGPLDVAYAVARSVVLQSATLQAPSELIVGAIVAEDRASEWEWLKWLPHSTATAIGFGAPAMAVGADAGIELLNALQPLIATRLESASSGVERTMYSPHVLLLIDGNIAIDRSRFRYLLESGADAGVTVVWVSSDSRRVPNACRTVLTIEPGSRTVTLGAATEGVSHGAIPLEGVPLESAEIVARAMSPIIDISADIASNADLPKSVGLVDLLGGLEILDSPDAIAERWHQSQTSRTLRGPVGAYAGGTLSIDLRVDGPHGLVGGTTGAGKSEFLQSFLTGLAASHSPERITFLLVDYKGGSAFGDLVDQFDEERRLVRKGLRHTVGMITDLTPAMVQRALISLQAELHRREVILNKHRMKDLMEMEKNRIPGTPPSLLIVVDEFAALAKEVPAFVDGIVDIAQRGRSLGMHLLLATQKPGGVVTPNIQANTNLRVALRVASDEESRDIVGVPDAGRLDRSTPGRGVIKRGPTDLAQFQSAYVGGITAPDTAATLEIGEFSLGGINWFAQRRESMPNASADIDLKRLVSVINSAADSTGVEIPRRPWLDPLPAVVDLLDLPRPPDDSEIYYGLSDLPESQSRSVATFSPDKEGSMLIYGMGGSGKSVALRTIAAAFGLTKSRSSVFVYGLDFVGRGLEMLLPLSHVGAIIAGDDYERTTRLLKDLRNEIATRSVDFASSSSLSEYRESSGNHQMHRVVVLIDGYDNFLGTYERLDRGEWTDLLPRLVADGRQLGIHFVLTGTRRSSFPMALTSQVSSRLVFKMASDDDYVAVGVDPRSFETSTPAGRARFGNTEVQVSIVGSASSAIKEAESLAKLGSGLESRTRPAPAIKVLPDLVERSEIATQCWLLDESLEPIAADLQQNLLITSGPRGGKTTALLSMFSALVEAGHQPLLIGDHGRIAGAGGGPPSDLRVALDDDSDRPILIDDLERVADPDLELALQTLLIQGQRRIVATSLITHARGYDQTIRTLRERCSVLILQPEPDLDNDLASTKLPRTSSQFAPGRGYLVTYGAARLVQVATP